MMDLNNILDKVNDSVDDIIKDKADDAIDMLAKKVKDAAPDEVDKFVDQAAKTAKSQVTTSNINKALDAAEDAILKK